MTTPEPETSLKDIARCCNVSIMLLWRLWELHGFFPVQRVG